MDEERLIRELTKALQRVRLWLHLTVIILLVHGLAVLTAAGIVWGAAGNLANQIAAAVQFIREQVGIWNGMGGQS